MGQGCYLGGQGPGFLEERGHYSSSRGQLGEAEGTGPGVAPLPACPYGPAQSLHNSLAGWHSPESLRKSPLSPP